MRALAQSTAYDLMVFATDSTDHVSGKTGLTLTVTASKAGAAFASITPTVTERGNGWYSLALTTSHTDTLGDLAIRATATGADPINVLCVVRNANTGGLAALPNAAAGADGGLPVLSSSATTLAYTVSTVTTLTGHTAQTGDAYAIVASGTYGNAAIKTLIDAVDDYVDTEVGAIKAKTDQLTFTVAGHVDANPYYWRGGAIPAVNVTGAPIVDVGYVDGQTASTISGAIDANVIEVAGETATATATVSFDNLDAAVSSRSTYAGGDTAGTTTLLSRLSATRAGYLDNLTNLDAAVTTRLATASYTAPPTAAAISDAVWDETLADHLTGGSTGAGLNAAGSAGDPWSTALPGAYSSGTAGNILGNRLDAAVSGRSSHSAADVWAVGTRTITGGTVSTVSDKTGYSLASTGLDAVVVEGSTTIIASARGWNSALLGKASGLGTTTAVYRDLADSKNRISATVDADGNRSAVTRDLT